MRVSNNLMANTITGNISKNSERLLMAQIRVSTQKLINKPSDDPVGIGKVLDYRKTVSSIEQYKNNIAHAKTRIEVGETALGLIDELLIDAKNIAMNQSIGSNESPDRAIAAEQIKEIREQILQLINTNLRGNYIFAGQQSNKPAFSGNGDYDGDSEGISIIAGERMNVKINLTGEEIFPVDADNRNVFYYLDHLQSALEADPYVMADIADQTVPLNEAHEQVNNARAFAASKFTRLGLAESTLNKLKLNVQNMLSSTEDADLAQAIVELQRQETAYEVTLASSAKVIQPNLLNFLR